MALMRTFQPLWVVGDQRCVICWQHHDYELVLFNEGKLVAAWPCETYEKACELSVAWRSRTPNWLPQ